MKATYVALLRSVNVAGHDKVKMSDLADVFRGLGYAEVSTYMQSGNVIFMTDEDVAATDIEAAICADLGMDITIMVRTAAELALQRFLPEAVVVDGANLYCTSRTAWVGQSCPSPSAVSSGCLSPSATGTRSRSSPS